MSKSTPAQQYGGKAVNLIRLRELEYSVPRFECISVDELLHVLDGDRSELDQLLSGLDREGGNSVEISERIVGYLDRSIDNQRLKSVVGVRLADCAGDTYAVRSSATVEDGREASFAGQFASFLSVAKDAVLVRVVDCWKSLYSPAVLRYCRKHGIDPAELGMAVIIQDMVNPNSGGVMFSVNPNGPLNEAVIAVTQGSDKTHHLDDLSATTYFYNLHDNLYYFSTQQDSPQLEGAVLERLVSVLRKLMADFGPCIDVEYVIENRRTYVLQVRTITSVESGDTIILDNSNICESYPGVTLPLTESFAKEAYSSTFQGVVRRGLGVRNLGSEYQQLTDHLVESRSGRMYYRLENWLRLISIMPFGHKVLPVWMKMLGVKEVEEVDVAQRLPLTTRVRALMTVISMSVLLPKRMRALNQDFQGIADEFKQTFDPQLSLEALLELRRSMKDKLLENWDLTLSNDMYLFIHAGLMQKFLGDNEGSIDKLAVRSNRLASLEPVYSLVKLRELAIASGYYNQLEKITNNEQLEVFIGGANDEFSQAFSRHLELYGDRSVAELKLETETWRTSPILLLQAMLRLQGDELDQPEGLDQAPRADIIGWKKPVVHWLRRRVAIGVYNRETSRLNRSRIFGMMRDIFLAAGARLAEKNIIAVPRDVFYLTIEELEMVSSRALLSYTELVAQRRQQYEQYEQLPPFSRLVFVGSIKESPVDNVNTVASRSNSRSLVGTGCSRGVVSGEVVVVTSPQAHTDVAGKILVAKTTDPGWVFLMLSARGIISETGSLLSHTAIVARELGRPAVVGVEGAVSRLASGDKVRLDGATGVIEVLS